MEMGYVMIFAPQDMKNYLIVVYAHVQKPIVTMEMEYVIIFVPPGFTDSGNRVCKCTKTYADNGKEVCDDICAPGFTDTGNHFCNYCPKAYFDNGNGLCDDFCAPGYEDLSNSGICTC